MSADSIELDVGIVVRKGDTEYQIIVDPDRDSVATEIGDRRLSSGRCRTSVTTVSVRSATAT